MSDSSDDDRRPHDLPEVQGPLPPPATEDAPLEHQAGAGWRQRATDRVRRTSTPVRWIAAGLLAVLLLLGAGAAGFALGHDGGGRDGGQVGDRHGGDRDGDRDGDRRGDGDGSRGGRDGQDEGQDDTTTDTPTPTPTPTVTPSGTVTP